MRTDREARRMKYHAGISIWYHAPLGSLLDLAFAIHYEHALICIATSVSNV